MRNTNTSISRTRVERIEKHIKKNIYYQNNIYTQSIDTKLLGVDDDKSTTIEENVSKTKSNMK